MMAYYTEPKISKGKKWCVYFRYDGILRKYYHGIIQDGTLEQKLESALILKHAVHNKLKKGWIPKGIEKYEIELKNVRLNDALDELKPILKEKLSKKGYSDYSGTIRFVQKALKDLKWERIPCNKLERLHVKRIFTHIKESRNWSNHAYNKNLGYFKSIITYIIDEFEYLKENPAHGIKSLKYQKKPVDFPTNEEQTKIIEYLKKEHYTFLRFIKVLYQTGIRPVELTRLRVGDINLHADIILLKAEDSKNGMYRMVPIKPDIKSDLEKMIRGADPEWYLFGSPRKIGGKYKKEDSYCPSPFKTKRDTPTKHWKKYVKDDLGIDKKLYSMKHKAANDMMFAGVDLDAIKSTFGHSDTKITEIYANQINELRFKQVKEKQVIFE